MIKASIVSNSIDEAHAVIGVTTARRTCERCSALEKALLSLSAIVAAKSCRVGTCFRPNEANLSVACVLTSGAPELVSWSSEAHVPIPANAIVRVCVWP